MTALRTFLCPDCDGWGRIQLNTSGDPQRDHDIACHGDCDESGVVWLSCDEGERMGLQRWTGDEGRALERTRLPHVDPLDRMHKGRTGNAYQRTFYRPAREVAMRQPLNWLDYRMREAAIRMDVQCQSAAQAWRVAA